MITTLVIPEPMAAILRELVRLPTESAAVLLARAVHGMNGDLRLLSTELHEVPHEFYLRQEIDQLLIRSEGYVPSLARAEDTGTVPVWLHTHPGNHSSPRPSSLDVAVDEQLSDLFRIRSGSEYYGTLILSHENGALSFTGHLEHENGRLPIDRLFASGSRFELAWNDLTEHSSLPSLFDRNVRAFGGDIQRVLQGLQFSIVGCGGTGSSVAEQLVRLGARKFILIDPDNLSDSNLTRVYGSTAADIGKPKVQVVAEHLRRIAPDVDVTTIRSMITVEETARQLIGSDVIFGCTDDNAGRLVLSRFSTYMLTPVIDSGVLLSSTTDRLLEGIHGRVTILYPGTACLVCRGRIDLSRASSEMLTPNERIRRVDEGYVPALPGIEPAVVAYTTYTAAIAVSELLERLIAYGVEPPPSELLLRIHDREISTNVQKPRERHYCHPSSGKLGLGITEPFLEQTWSQ